MNEVKEAVESAVKAGIIDTAAMDGLDELIKEFAPAVEVVEVTVAGRKYTFQALVDKTKFNALKAKARGFVTLKSPPPAIPEAKKWMDADDETKTYAFILSELSIEPKLDKFRLLKVAKEAFLAFDEIKTGYLLGLSKSRADVEREEIEKRKNESSETSPGETA